MTCRPRTRDASFLHMAAIAAVGGTLAIAFSIGFPIWAWQQGRPYTPAFSLFAAWGLAALGGAYACWRTYLISDDTPRPPRGGIRLQLATRLEVRSAAASAADTERRAA